MQKTCFVLLGFWVPYFSSKKDGANGAGTRFDQSPPPAAERKSKTRQFLAREIRESVLHDSRQDHSYPPPANREFLERGAGSRCGDLVDGRIYGGGRDTLR